MMDLPRLLFAFGLFGDWYSLLRTILTADRPAYDREPGYTAADLRQPAKQCALVGTLLFLALLVWFVDGRLKPLSAVLMLGAFALLRWAAVRTWPGDIVVSLGKYSPNAAALLAYVVTYMLTVRFEPAFRVACGREAAAGVFGACYLLSFCSKLRKSGLAWARPGAMGLPLAERAHGASPLLSRLRLAAMSRPWVCSAFAWGTLAVELAAVGFFFPAARLPVFIAICALHLGIAVLLGYFELKFVALGLALVVATAP